MNYFSGFCLCGEEALFADYLEATPYTVAGFSYGAIRAVEAVAATDRRVEKLQLLSPAWFVGQSEGYKRTQMLYFGKDPRGYRQRFYANVVFPSGIDLSPYASEGTAEELALLLNYSWDPALLRSIADRGTAIEIYLGAKDRIIDAVAAHDYFRQFGTSFLFRDYGHLLLGEY